MVWSEIKPEKFYIPYDENQKVIRGFFLKTLNLDLNNVPHIFWEPFSKFGQIPLSHSTEQKIYVRDIIGTVHCDYGGFPLIQAYMRLKRGDKWILKGEVTRGKYFYHMKKPTTQQRAPVSVSVENGKYVINGNGNHRAIFYKLMMMAEIYEKKHYYIGENEYLDYECFRDISDKYWLNAIVRT